MPSPAGQPPRIEDCRTYTDFQQLDENSLMKEYCARALSGLNPDNTPYTMPISIKADIPDFSQAIQQALNQQTAIAQQQAAATSDQVNALQNLANQVATAAQGSTSAAQQTAQQILQAAQAQAAAQTSATLNTLVQIANQNDTVIIQNARIAYLLTLLVGEEVTVSDANDFVIANT